MKLPVEELLRQPLFAWMPPEAPRTFQDCFDLEAEELAPGERRESRGRIGYVLSGALELEGGETGLAAPERVFGLLDARAGQVRVEEVCLTAREPSVVIWMNREIMTSVCYFDCWFHGRFVTEMRAYLAAQRAASRSGQGAEPAP